MLQKRMALKNFRNYKLASVELSPQVNVFYGKNAQGKTNFLEAVSYLVLGRSFRTYRDEELIREGAESFFLKGEFSALKEGDPLLTIEIGRSNRQFLARINGVKYYKKNDLFGRVKMVIFSPDDLQLIKGGPVYRRDYLDLYLAQAYPAYREALRKFFRILKQRNKLLKELQEEWKDDHLLESWTQEFITCSSRVIFYRLRGLKAIAPWVKEYHRRIAGAGEELEFSYQGCASDLEMEEAAIEEQLRRCLERNKRAELRRGMTLVGPHRDDLVLSLKNIGDLRTYGSQGQQRTAALALKLAMVDLLTKVEGTSPLLLLDDVFSEFDDRRKRELLKVLASRTQTLITTTKPENVEDLGGEIKFFHVEDGMIDETKQL